MSARAFIPRDKPKSWVIAVVACMTGFGIGVVAFLLALNGLPVAMDVARPMFLFCWAVGAAAGVSFLLGLFTGRYRRVEEKPWRDQIW